MSLETRSILMRANRLLGASMVEANLVTMDQLEVANEKLLEIIANGDPRQSTLLGILAYDMKVIKEDDILQHCVDEHSIGMVDLRSYDVHEELRKSLNPDFCWATWTVPFDKEEDFTYVATAYYLSPAVRTYWEKELGGKILWYGTTMEAISDFLEKLREELAAKQRNA